MIKQCFVENNKYSSYESLRSFESGYVNVEQAKTLVNHQMLYNETLSDIDSDIDSHKFLGSFRRMSLPIVLRTLRLMKTPQLVCFTPVCDPTAIVSRHHLKTVLPDPTTMSTLSTSSSISAEEELIRIVPQAIALEIDQYVLQELRSHAGIVFYFDPTNPETDFQSCYKDVMNLVKQQSGVSPNWVVASSEVSNELTSIASDFIPATDGETTLLGIRLLGTLVWREGRFLEFKQRLFENTFCSEFEMILGYQGKDANTFQFQPKILLEAIPSRQSNQRVKRARLQTQFNTTWPNQGGNLYARITVKSPDETAIY